MSTARPLVTRGAALALASTLLAVAPGALAAPATSAAAGRSFGPPRGFLRLELPRKKAYVGESIPITVRAYYRADTSVTITGAPTLRDTSFTLAAGDAQQGHAEIDGVRYLVVTWKDHLSPVKAGHYALGMDVPSTLEWQDVAPRPSRSEASGFGDPFGDDFFSGSAFGGGDPFAQMQRQMQRMMNDAVASEGLGAVQRKEVVLRSGDALLDVEPVPAAGRPADFSGAVGHFAMKASVPPGAVRVGEPITLTLTVTGEGNFDRVSVPAIPESSDWKTYGATATDGPSQKTFAEPMVPKHAGVLAIPASAFSYFDPDAETYITARAAPISVDVAAGAGVAAASNGTVPAATSGPTLAPNADDLGHPVADLAPPFTRRAFWTLQAVPLALLLAALGLGVGARRFGRDSTRPRRRAARRAIAEQRTAMDRAVKAGDATAFFAAARGAIQEALGLAWRIAPAAISLSEVSARLEAEDSDKIRSVFDADAARFSGAERATPDLIPWRRIVEQELAHIETLEAA